MENQSKPEPESCRLTLSRLPLPAKVLVSALLLTMAFGMVGAVGQIIVHDIIPTFFSESGGGGHSGHHGGEKAENNASGHHGGGDSEDFSSDMKASPTDSGKRGDLFAGEPLPKSIAPPEKPFYESDQFVWTLKWSHIHLFGMNMIFIFLGCVTFLLDIGERARAWLIGLPFAGVLTDIAAMWLKGFVSPAFFWLHIPGGGLFGAIFLFVFFRAMIEMWLTRSSA